MKLKKHLNFIGLPNKNQIVYNKISGKEQVIIDVDDFNRIWDLLLILSYEDDDFNKKIKINNWKNLYNVTDSEYTEYMEFLFQNSLLYEKIGSNNYLARTSKFYNNFINTTDSDFIPPNIKNEKVMIIGLGTVGTYLVNNLIQFGVKDFYLVDFDTVEESNIFHQMFYTKKDIGRKKVEVIKERLLNEYDFNIRTFDVKLNSENDVVQLLAQNVTSIFLCFDVINDITINKISEISKKKSLKTYISSYSLTEIQSARLSNEQVNNIIQFNEFKYVLGENSGIGVLGDIAAVLLVKIWLKDTVNDLDITLDNPSFDLFGKQEKIVNNIKNINYLFNVLPNASDVEFYKKHTIFPYVLQLFVRNLKNIMESEYNKNNELINYIYKKYNLELFYDDDKLINDFYYNLDKEKILINSNMVGLLEAQQMLFNGYKYTDEEILNYNNKFFEYSNMFREILKIKISNISEDRKVKEEIYLPYFLKIAKHLTIKEFPDGKIDFLDYNPTNFKFISFDKAVELILNMDDIYNEYFDIRQMLVYMIDHKFISIDIKNSKPITIWNSFYGTSDIILDYNESLDSFLFFAHELGHSYYNLFLNKGDNIEKINKEFSETLAILVELRIINGLKNNKNYYNMITKQKICSLFFSNLSIDFLKEGMIKANDFTEQSIQNIKDNYSLEISGNHEILNEKLFKYNYIFSNILYDIENESYIYLKGYIYSKILIKEIEKNIEYDKKIIDYIKSNKIEDLNIHDLFKDVFDIDLKLYDVEPIFKQIMDEIEEVYKDV